MSVLSGSCLALVCLVSDRSVLYLISCLPLVCLVSDRLSICVSSLLDAPCHSVCLTVAVATERLCEEKCGGSERTQNRAHRLDPVRDISIRSTRVESEPQQKRYTSKRLRTGQQCQRSRAHEQGRASCNRILAPPLGINNGSVTDL